MFGQMRDIDSMSRGNAFGQKQAQLNTIKGLVVCNSWDLEPLDLLNGYVMISTEV